MCKLFIVVHMFDDTFSTISVHGGPDCLGFLALILTPEQLHFSSKENFGLYNLLET